MNATRNTSHGRLLQAILAAIVVVALGGLAQVSGATTTSTRPHAPDAAATCLGRDLDVWLNTQGDGAAGSVFYTVEFTNLSLRPCALYGYPRVSAIDLGGHRIGPAAIHDNVDLPRTITLAGSSAHSLGGTAIAVLRIVQADNFPSTTCDVANAAGVRVYSPGGHLWQVVPFPFQACSQDDVTLMIGAFQK